PLEEALHGRSDAYVPADEDGVGVRVRDLGEEGLDHRRLEKVQVDIGHPDESHHLNARRHIAHRQEDRPTSPPKPAEETRRPVVTWEEKLVDAPRPARRARSPQENHRKKTGAARA